MRMYTVYRETGLKCLHKHILYILIDRKLWPISRAVTPAVVLRNPGAERKAKPRKKRRIVDRSYSLRSRKRERRDGQFMGPDCLFFCCGPFCWFVYPFVIGLCRSAPAEWSAKRRCATSTSDSSRKEVSACQKRFHAHYGPLRCFISAIFFIYTYFWKGFNVQKMC